MGDEGANDGAPFDLDGLKELIELMEAHGLTEINLRRGDEQWRLRRGGEIIAAPAPVVAAAPPPPVAAPAPEANAPAAAAPSAPAAEGDFILSPTVGTYYASPSPDDPAFVKVGDRVEADTIVCLVEAMKTFNQIPAGKAGKIVELLVTNGDAVDVNTKLFRIEA